jgi:hypothetical protein
VLAWFSGEGSDEPDLYDMDAEEFNWVSGIGGTGVLVDEWQAWEGGLVFDWSTAGELCAESTVDLALFDGMHFGLGIGPLSSFMTTEYEDLDDWDASTDPYNHASQYIAMNHPDSSTSLGYDFIGYDFNGMFFGQADMTICADGVCGGFKADADDLLVGGDHRLDVGSRLAYVQGSAWWFEDFPRLDLDMMGSGFSGR